MIDVPEFPLLSEFLSGHPLPEWASAAHGSRAGSDPLPPSFAAGLDRMVRAASLERQAGGDPLAWKARQREWVADWLGARGYAVAKVLASGFPLSALPEQLRGLDRFVVKPMDAHSSLGVMALLRDGKEYAYASVETGRRYDVADLMEALVRPMEAFGFPDRWQIEELLLPASGVAEPLVDFKFYAFRGHAPLVLQAVGRDAERRYRWLDRSWAPVRTGKYEDSLDDSLALPDSPQALLAAAERLSAELELPFCRVDLYETVSGVAVGELTPEPGEYHVFDAATDRYLGACFEMAEAGWVPGTGRERPERRQQ